MRHEDIILDFKTRTVTRRKKPIRLRGVKFSTFAALMTRKGKVLSKQQLHRETGGRFTNPEYDPTLAVKMRINGVRSALGPPNVIKTVVGEGYMLTDSAEAPQKTHTQHLPRGHHLPKRDAENSLR